MKFTKFYPNSSDGALSDFEIRKIIKRIEEVIAKTDYKINDKFINNVKGFFSKQGIHSGARVKLDMRTPQAEILIGLILIGELGYEDLNKEQLSGTAQTFQVLTEYSPAIPFYGHLMRDYLEHLEFINPEKKYVGGPGKQRIYGRKKKLVSIVNPKTKKMILTTGKTFREIYQGIKLKDPEPKDISNVDTLDYAIKSNCARSLLNKYGIKSDLEEYTYLDMFKLAKDKVSITVETITGVQIDKQLTGNKNSKTIRMVIHNGHAYLKSSASKVIHNGVKVITKVDEINDYKNSRLVVTNEELFKDIMEEIKKTCELQDYNDNKIKYGTNEIVWWDKYEDDSKILGDANTTNIYTHLDKLLNLRGTMNEHVYEQFKIKTKDLIRCYDLVDKPNTIQFDHIKSYPSALIKVPLPIPSINDEFQKFNEGDKIIDYGFYYCKIKGPLDDILANARKAIHDGISIKELQKDDRIEQIYIKFIPSKFKIIDKDQIKGMPWGPLTRYIGWLQKSKSIDIDYYTNISGDEEIALKKRHGKEFIRESDDELSLTKNFLVTKTGILANRMIKGNTNLQMYRFNKKFMKDNPDAVLNRIKTDSLGYLLEGKWKGNDMIGKEPGLFRIEKEGPIYQFTPSHEIKVKRSDCKPKIKDYGDLNIHSITDDNKNDYDKIERAILKGQSMFLRGRGGSGKSYCLKNTIIPLLEEQGLKYIICGTTKDNSSLVNGIPVQGLFERRSVQEINRKFKKVDYLIIDESSQLKQNIYKYIELVKKNDRTKIILLGDQFQVKAIDATYETWLNSPYVLSLCENNVFDFDVTNYRCDKPLVKMIKELEVNFKNRRKITKIIEEACKATTKIMDGLAYTNKACDIVKANGKECQTVHKKQGKKIDGKFAIYELNKMTPDLMITAVGRATKLENIHVYMGKIV